MRAPLYSAVKNYKGIRFHMPGHKGRIHNSLYKSAKYDITELDFSDNLLEATGVIKEAEQLAADVYKVARSLMFTTGATTALLTAMKVARDLSPNFIIFRNSHKSIYNAIKLLGINPNFISADYDSNGFASILTVIQIEKALVALNGGTLILTSPDYFGRVYDIESISKICKKLNILLIVDAAHGAHFAYSSLLPQGAELYADMSIHGGHKTLPMYTGAAYLHILKKDLISAAEAARSLIHSSSPSYLVMTSMDYARAVFDENGEELYYRLKKAVTKVEQELDVLKTDDFSRLLLRCGREGEVRLKAHNIYPECRYGDYVVLITTPYDIRALKNVTKALRGLNFTSSKIAELNSIKPLRAITYNEAIYAPSERILIEKAEGRIIANEIGLYPPATPLIVAGEIIDKNMIEFIRKKTNNIYGLADGYVSVLI